jgi:hypothetical protein
MSKPRNIGTFRQRIYERERDFELLVLDALADLLASKKSLRTMAMDECAAKIVALARTSSAQRRRLCEYVELKLRSAA